MMKAIAFAILLVGVSLLIYNVVNAQPPATPYARPVPVVASTPVPPPTQQPPALQGPNNKPSDCPPGTVWRLVPIGQPSCVNPQLERIERELQELNMQQRLR